MPNDITVNNSLDAKRHYGKFKTKTWCKCKTYFDDKDSKQVHSKLSSICRLYHHNDKDIKIIKTICHRKCLQSGFTNTLNKI